MFPEGKKARLTRSVIHRSRICGFLLYILSLDPSKNICKCHFRKRGTKRSQQTTFLWSLLQNVSCVLQRGVGLCSNTPLRLSITLAQSKRLTGTLMYCAIQDDLSTKQLFTASFNFLLLTAQSHVFIYLIMHQL